MPTIRLNVTEAERLGYSRRKLQAISALRNAGINPAIFGLHKDYRVPGVRGRVYLVQHPTTGAVFHFATLAEVHAYAGDYQAWKAQTRFTWAEWRQAPVKAPPRRVPCGWPGCRFSADGQVDQQPFCRAHAFIYGQMRLASGKLVGSR